MKKLLLTLMLLPILNNCTQYSSLVGPSYTFVETGNILQEIQSGYMLGERLLRPALVSVAKKKTAKKEEINQKKEDK